MRSCDSIQPPPCGSGFSAAVNDKVITWRRDIHAHPELGNRELRTAKLVADHLRSLGLQVRTGIAHTGVVAIIKGGKPGARIALRADMDALPVTEQVELPFASKVTTSYRGETVGVIKGGIRSNIIPDQVELIGTIRTFDPAMREQVFTELRRVASNVAQAHGATVEAQIPDGPGNPVTFNNPALVSRILPSLRQAVGAANVKEIPLITGAEDFSFYALQVPSVFFFVGATPLGTDPGSAPSNHSPQFFLDEGALGVGTRALLQVSLDYLSGAAVD